MWRVSAGHQAASTGQVVLGPQPLTSLTTTGCPFHILLLLKGLNNTLSSWSLCLGDAPALLQKAVLCQGNQTTPLRAMALLLVIQLA